MRVGPPRQLLSPTPPPPSPTSRRPRVRIHPVRSTAPSPPSPTPVVPPPPPPPPPPRDIPAPARVPLCPRQLRHRRREVPRRRGFPNPGGGDRLEHVTRNLTRGYPFAVRAVRARAVHGEETTGARLGSGSSSSRAARLSRATTGAPLQPGMVRAEYRTVMPARSRGGVVTKPRRHSVGACESAVPARTRRGSFSPRLRKSRLRRRSRLFRRRLRMGETLPWTPQWAPHTRRGRSPCGSRPAVDPRAGRGCARA